MTIKSNRFRSIFAALAFAAALLAFPQIMRAAAQQNAAAAARLDKKQFAGVRVDVSNGIATLTGTVDLYEYKADAAKRVLHAKDVTAVRNLIEVAGPAISDKELQDKLVEKLEYDAVGYGNVFDAISVGVSNGMVSLGGHAHNYINRDSALALVATTRGVKDMVDNIEVDPVSSMDDQSRVAVARAVYGFTTLNKYALDPGKPIRISVHNGHVELYGVVDSQADKDAAYLRASGVSGVFSVKNYLQVANQRTEK
jgi:hyperosmotically inducible periplasmic protein